MGNLRAVRRLLLVALTTVFFELVLLGGSIVYTGSRRGRLRVRNFIFRNWARWVLRALNVRLTTRGKAPQSPFFLVSNHLSYIDILILASRVDAVFIAKSEIQSWPIVGFLCRSVGTLFVDRTSRSDVPRVVAEIDRVLADGQGIVLFAEGTSSRGVEVLPFRPPLLEVAARRLIPVSYASLTYRTPGDSPPAHLAVCWWGGMAFGGHAWRMFGLPGFDATLSFGEKPITDGDRKRLAERLQAAVSGLFLPVGEVPPDPLPGARPRTR